MAEVSRREFLELLIGAGISVATLSGCTQKELSRGIYPKDILTDKELTDNHIHIYQTKDTRLMLRQSVFNIPLFQSSKKGIVETNIILVDGTSVRDPVALEKLPEDIKPPISVLQKVWVTSNITRTDLLRASIENFKQSSDPYKQNVIDELNQELKEIEYYLKETGQQNFTEGPGTFFHTDLVNEIDKSFFTKFPQFKNRAFVMLAVGGSERPNPSKDACIDPSNIKKFEKQYRISPDSYRFRSLVHQYKGFTLRHEAAHYIVGNNEYEADSMAYESLEDAWKFFKESGDTGKYSFVFTNSLGLTLT